MIHYSLHQTHDIIYRGCFLTSSELVFIIIIITINIVVITPATIIIIIILTV